MSSRPGSISSLSSTASSLGGRPKHDVVTDLMERLRVDLTEKNLLPQQRNTILEQVKVYGRDINGSDAIFTREGIETLTRHAFDGNSPTTSREALRCIANAMLLRPETRQMFVDLGYTGKAAERLKCDNADDEFLISRILFLTTYDTNLDFEKLVAESQLADSINEAMVRHAKKISSQGQHSQRAKRPSPPSPVEGMALTETLKLIFNITHYYPGLATNFGKSMKPILKMLNKLPLPHPPLQPPINYLINALMNLDLEDKKCSHIGSNPLFPKFDAKCNAERLINVLDQALHVYKEADLDSVAAPVLTLIRKVYEIAPDSVKKYMEWLLLPTDDERSRPLGQSDTLSSRLLRLSTSPLTPNLRENISAMFFELSDKDANKFVKNIGYGFASGFLMSHNLPVPENASDAWSTSEAGGPSVPVNPVTGQRVDAEPKDEGPPMSREEKEREAERLFVLFERLKATGVMNVVNPVEMSRDQGRFEEVEDSDEDLKK